MKKFYTFVSHLTSWTSGVFAVLALLAIPGSAAAQLGGAGGSPGEAYADCEASCSEDEGWAYVDCMDNCYGSAALGGCAGGGGCNLNCGTSFPTCGDGECTKLTWCTCPCLMTFNMRYCECLDPDKQGG
jgi:hypothetical protein